MYFIKKWSPFIVVTTCYLLVLRLLLLTLDQFLRIMTFSHMDKPTLGIPPEEYGFGDVIKGVFLKFWSASPAHLYLGPSVFSEIVETFIGVAYVFLLGGFAVMTWFLSTRVYRPIKGIIWWSGKGPRWVMFLTVAALIMFQFIIWVQIPIHENVLPKIEAAVHSYNKSEFTEYTEASLKNIKLLNILLLLIPVAVVCGLVEFMRRKWKEHHEELPEVFYEWQFRSKYLGRFFEHQGERKYPDIVLGEDVETGEDVILYGQDRNNSSIIVGAVGTGKTSALIIPMAKQDLDYMVDYINNFDNETDEDRKYRVNGVTIVETSNDLCKKVYQLAKARNIPEEAIFYLDPTNKNTVSINPLRGPIEKAVETFTKIIQGLAANSDEFFKQAQRSHLKHYVYLLKLAKKNQATFDDLIELYHDPRLAADMFEEVEKTIPENWEQITDRDLRNHWMIVQGICAWFRERGLFYAVDKNGIKLTYPSGHKHAGKQVVFDKQAEYVQGLRNILDDLSSSKLMRRVLFGNSDFDIDTHLKAGGVLLVNTAKGEMAELSNVLGKFLIMLIENGVFRRDSNEGDPFHEITIDEFPDYIYDRFREFPAQSRKYKAITTVACQTLAQLSLDFGDDFMYTLLSSLRNKMLYGDCDPKTAKVFSELFGEDEVYETTESEMYEDALMSSPGRRDSYSVAKRVKPRLSGSKIIHLKEFQAAVKLVVKKRSTPVRVIKAKWVPENEFVDPKKKVDPEKAQAWLEYRRKLMVEMENQLLRDQGILIEGESNPKDAVPTKELEKLEVMLKQQPIYLDEKDKEVAKKLYSKVMIPLDFSDTSSVGLIPDTKDQVETCEHPRVDQSVDQIGETAEKAALPEDEGDLFSAIYSQTSQSESKVSTSTKEQDESSVIKKNDQMILKEDGPDSIHTEHEGMQEITAEDILSSGTILVNDLEHDDFRPKSKPLSPQELYKELKKSGE